MVQLNINLAEAALIVSTHEYPDLDIKSYLSRLDAYADVIRTRLPLQPSHWQIIEGMNHYLFEDLGFVGNIDDYYDPRNSYLNDVIDRRLGIPITLGLIYMEIGQRLGLSIKGISFPGHFLVKCAVSTSGVVIIDPFSRGNVLSNAELDMRLRYVFGNNAPSIDSMPELLRSASKLDVLTRILYNLKTIYYNRNNFEKALSVANQLIKLRPDISSELRDRGHIYRALECFQSAMRDYYLYLEREPDAADQEEIRILVVNLQKESTAVH